MIIARSCRLLFSFCQGGLTLLGLALGLSGLILAATGLSARAQDTVSLSERIAALPTDEIEELFVFVSGNVLFTLHHEAGHMLISELELPVLGQEEDAVDNLATISMLAYNDDDMDLLLSSAMVGWFLMSEQDPDNLVFYTEHDLDQQRGYRMLCLMVGSDPDAFTDLAVDLDLPRDRIETCGYDYDQALLSWEAVTDSHLKPASDHTRRISVRYGAASEALEPMAIFLKESRLMEMVAEEIDDLYELPEDITFTSLTCGEENAFWDPDRREMTLCYELMAEFASAYLDLLVTN